MRVLACLQQAEQTREIAATKKICFILSQAFSGFLWIQLSRLGAICNMRGRLVGVSVPPGTPTSRQTPKKTNHTEISISYKADWPIRSGFLLTLITYVTPLFLSTLATWAQYLSQCDSLHVASLVVWTGVAEEPPCFPEFSCSHCITSTSCLVFPPILPAWPISVLLKYD